jgi:hypothetical protein
MKIELIGLITAFLGLLVLFKGPRFGVTALAVSTLLGSAAAIQLPALGGSSVPPSALLLAFFVVTILSSEQLRRLLPLTVAYPSPGFWLLAICVYAGLSAIFFPTIFEGLIFVYPLARVDPTKVILTSLTPQAANITQPAYLLADLLCFVAVSAFAIAGGTVAICRAIVITSAANLFFFVSDALSYFGSLQDALSIIRNAHYTIFDVSNLAGQKRFIGSFTEPTAFAYATIGLLVFCFVLSWQGIWRRVTGSIAILLLAAVLLSASSAGYVTLGVCGTGIYAFCLVRLLIGQATRQEVAFVLASPVVLLLMVVATMLNPSLWDQLLNFLDATLYSKLETASGIERTLWNAVAVRAFVDTFGFGTGLGSVRASSFEVAVLSNIGLLGAVLFIAWFISLGRAAQRASRSPVAIERAIARAGTAAWLALLIHASLDASTPDLGFAFSIFAAVSASPALQRLTSLPETFGRHGLRNVPIAAPAAAPA